MITWKLLGMINDYTIKRLGSCIKRQETVHSCTKQRTNPQNTLQKDLED